MVPFGTQRVEQNGRFGKDNLRTGEAVQLRPASCPLLARCLDGHGVTPLERLLQKGDTADIEWATQLHGVALGVTDDANPVKPNLLSNLGDALKMRFCRLVGPRNIMGRSDARRPPRQARSSFQSREPASGAVRPIRTSHLSRKCNYEQTSGDQSHAGQTPRKASSSCQPWERGSTGLEAFPVSTTRLQMVRRWSISHPTATQTSTVISLPLGHAENAI